MKKTKIVMRFTVDCGHQSDKLNWRGSIILSRTDKMRICAKSIMLPLKMAAATTVAGLITYYIPYHFSNHGPANWLCLAGKLYFGATTLCVGLITAGFASGVYSDVLYKCNPKPLPPSVRPKDDNRTDRYAGPDDLIPG